MDTAPEELREDSKDGVATPAPEHNPEKSEHNPEKSEHNPEKSEHNSEKSVTDPAPPVVPLRPKGFSSRQNSTVDAMKLVQDSNADESDLIQNSIIDKLVEPQSWNNQDANPEHQVDPPALGHEQIQAHAQGGHPENEARPSSGELEKYQMMAKDQMEQLLRDPSGFLKYVDISEDGSVDVKKVVQKFSMVGIDLKEISEQMDIDLSDVLEADTMNVLTFTEVAIDVAAQVKENKQASTWDDHVVDVICEPGKSKEQRKKIRKEKRSQQMDKARENFSPPIFHFQDLHPKIAPALKALTVAICVIFGSFILAGLIASFKNAIFLSVFFGYSIFSGILAFLQRRAAADVHQLERLYALILIKPDEDDPNPFTLLIVLQHAQGILTQVFGKDAMIMISVMVPAAAAWNAQPKKAQQMLRDFVAVGVPIVKRKLKPILFAFPVICLVLSIWFGIFYGASRGVYKPLTDLAWLNFVFGGLFLFAAFVALHAIDKVLTLKLNNQLKPQPQHERNSTLDLSQYNASSASSKATPTFFTATPAIPSDSKDNVDSVDSSLDDTTDRDELIDSGDYPFSDDQPKNELPTTLLQNQELDSSDGNAHDIDYLLDVVTSDGIQQLA